jgi:tripartite-type tricarboxylate transporter receptor subunit TctC
VVNTPEIKEALNKVGIEPKTTTIPEFATFVHDRIAEDAKVLKKSGAAAEGTKANQ